MQTVTFHKCSHCDGSGSVADDVALGAWFREQRKSLDPAISLRTAAVKVGISPTHMSELERGLKHWTLDMERRVIIALGLTKTPR